MTDKMANKELPPRGAWIEISTSALADNMRLIRKLTGSKTAVMAVVKADAYGHGAIKCAQVLRKNGAQRFAIATLEEGVTLREAGVTEPILCLGYLPFRLYREAVKHDIAISVYMAEQGAELARAAAAEGKKALCHIKVDTGFSRLGFPVSAASAKTASAIAALPEIEVEGVFSHFASADEKDKSFCRTQHEAFCRFIELCRREGLVFPLRHIANSAAILDMPEYLYEACRPGIILYGYAPSSDVPCPGLRPAMAVKAEIARIQQVAKGAKVGYGCTWTAERDSLIATIPLGYADGYPRSMQKAGGVLVNGEKAPITGRVCMDQFMVDITDVNNAPAVKVGDTVTVMGTDKEASITADDLAQAMGTINYEILCMFGNRLPKIYVE